MLRAVCVSVFVLMSGQTYAAGLMGSDTAWFSQFEKLCRLPKLGDAPKCRAAVEKVMEAKCDMRAFWKARDDENDTQVLPILPWPYGVMDVGKKPGVCLTK